MSNYVMHFNTQNGATKTIHLEDMFGWIFDDFVHEKIDRIYARGVIRDNGFSPTEVFHMLEILGLAKEEYDRPVKQDVMYG